MIKKRFFSIVMMFAVTIVAMAGTTGGHRFTLVIDPGHGGHDAGAVGSKSKEKNINLKVALAFGRLVERNCPDVKVVYTRKTDVFIPLDERANIANKAKADLFISVHTNALPKGKTARGFEVYTLGMHRAADNLDVAKRENSVILVEKDYQQRYQGFDPRSSESYIIFEFMQDKNMAKSVEMARMIQQEVCSQAARPNKGVHQAGFLVLRATSMPSCLVELGFITTSDEEQLLNSESGIEAHARGMYKAFCRYRKKYNSGAVASYEAPQRQSVGSRQAAPRDEVAEAVVEKKEIRRVENRPQQLVESPVRREPAVQEQHADLSDAVRETKTSQDDGDAPVFKIQILTSLKPLRSNDSMFKGVRDVDSYTEGKMTKYTVGSSTNYSEIYQLRKSLLDKFPEAFIIAFKNGEKMDVRAAIQEYRSRKQK